MTTIRLLKNALMIGQRLKSTIVMGKNPTTKQLLAVESNICKALNSIPELKSKLKKLEASHRRHRRLYDEVEELVLSDIIADSKLANNIHKFEP